MVAASSASASLKEYLRKYENTEEEEKKKKKKKKKKSKPDVSGVIVVDEDPVWQKPVQLEEENDDSEDEEKPQVDEDIEVKRMKRLEQIKTRRPFGAISEDGSGWVPVSESQNLNSDNHYPDMSPPRKRRSQNYTPSPEPELKASSSRPDTDEGYNDRNGDISPPRKRTVRNDTPSPEPNPRSLEPGKEVMDLSPPRQRRKHHYSPSPEPERKPSQSSDQDLDLSPPRRHRPNESNVYERKNTETIHRAPPGEDLSPPRKSRKDRPEPSHQQLNPNEIDASRVSSVSDLSPPRKIRKESMSLRERPKTGLVTGKDIKEEIAKTKKEDWLRFKDMDPSISGRNAEPVYRDKITGQRMSKDQILKSQKKEEKPKEIKLEWGKGLAQKREAEARQKELELEKDKPFARTRDDPDLDRMMKDRVRWGDPMAHLVKKKHSEIFLPDMGDNEKMKESGFIIPQDIPSHSWLKRGLEAAPNRYGIKPGRHWDGVDRSTGFEKQMFKRTNEKQATEREAYLWSVSDM